MRQSTSRIMMVRPVSFLFNQETASSNAFQIDEDLPPASEVLKNVLAEFDGFVDNLRTNGVEVTVINDTPNPPKPDAIFCNNWIMMQHSGEITLFPMEARNRRPERRKDILEKLKADYSVTAIHDLSGEEKNGKYLESTGSIVFDHENRLAYACLSARTNPELLRDFCNTNDYTPIAFSAYDQRGLPIYHTNVLMCVGSKLAIICSDAITDSNEKREVLEKLENTGHDIIDISYEQMNHFAGNMLELQGKNGDPLLIMSSQAYRSLNANQRDEITKHAKIVHSLLGTIERIGGGSARCMIAEIFLPR